MIYLDHAATSYPKNNAVHRAVSHALSCYGANPGRGGYPMALASSEQVYVCRERAATLFGVSDPRRVIFTPNCTTALNIVIKSLLKNGGRVVISDLEHNAVVRPLHALSSSYPCYDTAHVTVGDEEATIEAFRRAITPKTKAIVCTHASNVIGCVLPIERLAKLAHEHNIPLVVDAAQSAGHLPIRVERDGIDYVCAAGHKGLGGTMGTGLLICREDTLLDPLAEGGTGSHSLSLEQPAELPERLESGTPNVPGICALRAGIERLLRIGEENVRLHEHALHRRLYDGLSGLKGITLYSPYPCLENTTSVLSLRAKRYSVEELGERLAAHGVAVRCGLHCAPLAHKTIGTLPEGTVRLSIGWSNTMAQMDTTLQIFKKIL